MLIEFTEFQQQNIQTEESGNVNRASFVHLQNAAATTTELHYSTEAMPIHSVKK